LTKLSFKEEKTVHVRDLMTMPVATVRPQADQEKAVLLAIQHDITDVPVVDKGRFYGAIVAGQIIDVMHDEHLEDALLSSGVRARGSNIMKLATARYETIIRSRAPWLLFGAVVGIGLGLISSFFQDTLSRNVAVAYFVPVVAYIADSVGTQSEAITVRALATLKINRARYLMRELVIGIILGFILGGIGGLGALLISGSTHIALVVGLSLSVASTLATILASLIPITFTALGKDPALGSGPLATAIQDVISVLIYFIFASLLL
jgi:magnesium transporter